MRPSGSGGAGASAVLALLDDATTSPASLRLASAPAALGTRPTVLSPRAASELHLSGQVLLSLDLEGCRHGRCRGSRLSARDRNAVFAGPNEPGTCFVHVAKVPVVQCKLHTPAFSGVQVNARKTAKSPARSSGNFGKTDIHLDNFVSVPLACIRNLSLNLEPLSGR